MSSKVDPLSARLPGIQHTHTHTHTRTIDVRPSPAIYRTLPDVSKANRNQMTAKVMYCDILATERSSSDGDATSSATICQQRPSIRLSIHQKTHPGHRINHPSIHSPIHTSSLGQIRSPIHTSSLGQIHSHIHLSTTYQPTRASIHPSYVPKTLHSSVNDPSTPRSQHPTPNRPSDADPHSITISIT